MEAISIKKLKFDYNEKKTIFEQLNLQILAGDKVGIIGPNGGGKTTLFLSICGILQPKEGEIFLLNKIVKKGEFRPEIGLVFQNPDDQLFCPRVRDDVAFGPENMGLNPSSVNDCVNEALSLTGISHLSDCIPHQLSGGEKCMVGSQRY